MKPENCIFSLECCGCFAKKTQSTKYHKVAEELPFTAKTIDSLLNTAVTAL